MGESSIAKNYGKHSLETTDWVKDTLIKKQDYYGFQQSLKEHNCQLYTGHVHAMPTALVFSTQQIATIVRNPVAQVLSHFNHFKRWNNFKGTLIDFVKSKGFRDLQSRILQDIPTNLIGFIGVTEDYNNSLALFNRMFGLGFQSIEANVNDKKAVPHIDDELVKLIEENNKQDIKLYQHALALHKKRYALFQQGKPWSFAAIQEHNAKHIAGYAFYQHDDKPVELALMTNGKVIQETTASVHKPGLARYGVPRNAFVGFVFRLEGIGAEEKLTIVIKETGQEVSISL
jgi:hypothetical protein